MNIAEKDAALDVLPDAWDSKDRPAVRTRSGGWLSAAMILGHNSQYIIFFYSIYCSEDLNKYLLYDIS